MKKLGILLLMMLALTGSISAHSLSKEEEKEAMKILEKAREKYAEQDRIRAKEMEEARRLEAERMEAERKAAEANMEASKKSQPEMMEEGQEVSMEKPVEKKAMTPLEKLEATRKQAMEKLDFYERVVRSVQREEAEIQGMKDIVNAE